MMKMLDATRVLLCTLLLASSCNALADPGISLNGPLVPLLSISQNLNHGYMTPCGYKQAGDNLNGCTSVMAPYGAWIDGPMNPYRFGNDTYFQISHSENFRIKVPGNDWGNRAAWTMEGATATGQSVTPAQRDPLESHYNNRNWFFSVYNEGNILYAITHHEWYPDSYAIHGVRGFDQTAPNGQLKPWITAVGWARSTDGGNTWAMRDVNEGSSRLITIPQPSDRAPRALTFGFMHPSNVVKEGNYYYLFTSAKNVYQDAQQVLRYENGVALFRTSNLATPLGWEFWNGAGWTTVDHHSYQGNANPGQSPHLFWKETNTGDCAHLFAMNVRRHKTSGKWILLGSRYCAPSVNGPFNATFTWTASLANPVDLDGRAPVNVIQNGVSLESVAYYSFYDSDGSADANYQDIGDHPILIVTVAGDTYKHQYLTLSGF
jgi:hypothetical protein